MATIDPILEKKVTELKIRLPTVNVDGAKLYVAEGDLLLSEAQLPLYIPHAAHVEPPNVPAGGAGQGLLGIEENGKILRWPPGEVLTYSLREATFNDRDEIATIRESMRAATRDWEATCGVAFRELHSLDATGPRQGEPLFTVRRYDARGTFIAAAFFPNDPPERRSILIDPSFFSATLPFDPVGVLRHELGHVIGFRHEHIRSGAPAVCPKEALDQTIDLTQYDPHSVMHYFCGQVGSRDLKITDLDTEGARKVYGPPLEGRRVAA